MAEAETQCPGQSGGNCSCAECPGVVVRCHHVYRTIPRRVKSDRLLVWLPPAEDAARAEAWLYEGRARDGADWRAALAGFIDRTGGGLALLEGFMAESSWP